MTVKQLITKPKEFLNAVSVHMNINTMFPENTPRVWQIDHTKAETIARVTQTQIGIKLHYLVQNMSKTIEHDCFSRRGILSADIINEHIVPSLGICAAETI